MSLDLDNYDSIATALFVQITVYNSTGVQEYVNLSDYNRSLTLDGVNYTGLGQLLSISESNADIRITPYELSLGISGIPTSNINLVMNSKIKGSKITVKRGIFDPITGVLLSISGNPAGRFNGVINNYIISEDQSEGSRDSTCTITFMCASNISILETKITGRATNPEVQQKLYPGDISMDRVPGLTNANYNFGAPK